MICTECEGKTRVSDSRSNLESVYRRRQCQSCKYHFSTYEVTQVQLLDILDGHLPDDKLDVIANVLDEHFPTDTRMRLESENVRLTLEGGN